MLTNITSKKPSKLTKQVFAGSRRIQSEATWKSQTSACGTYSRVSELTSAPALKTPAPVACQTSNRRQGHMAASGFRRRLQCTLVEARYISDMFKHLLIHAELGVSAFTKAKKLGEVGEAETSDALATTTLRMNTVMCRSTVPLAFAS